MNDLIHQIYATALDVNQWPKLLVSLTHGVQPSENEILPYQENRQVIQSHISQAIKINKKQNITDDKKDLVESSLSLLPIALFAQTNKSTGCDVLPLNSKAKNLLTELKTHLEHFFLKSLDNKKDSIHSRHIIHDEQAYLFLELPINQLELEDVSRVVLVSLSHQHLFDDSELFQRWQFSRKEVAICKQLLEGESIQSISLKNSRSVHTIRSQVKSIFQKSGLHSQIDLIRHFYASPISIAAIKTQSKSHPVSTLESFKLKLSDGRMMSWAEHGDSQGIPVILCHTMHQSRFTRHLDEAFASKVKIRIITPDRPGYGASDKNKPDSVKDWPKDLEELLQHLNIENFALLGLGLGTVFALASAQAFGKRVLRTTCVNPPDYIRPRASYDYPNTVLKAACKLAKYSPRLLLQIMRLAGRDVFLKDPISILTKLYPFTSNNDQKILHDKLFQQQLMKDFSESNRQGFGQALVNEIHFLINHDRIFEPEKIKTPVVCWHKKNYPKPDKNQIEYFVKEFPDAQSYCLDTDDDFMIYHEWKNYLYAAAYGYSA